jgi:hypothetical protein
MIVSNKVDPILKDLSLRFYKDIRVIKLICDHPLFFVSERIKDPTDIRAIMIPFFGKFVFKYSKTMSSKEINTKNHHIRIAQKCNQKCNTNVTTDNNE